MFSINNAERLIEDKCNNYLGIPKTLIMKKIALTHDKYAYIDEEDYDLVKNYAWTASLSRKIRHYAREFVKSDVGDKRLPLYFYNASLPEHRPLGNVYFSKIVIH